MDVRVCLSTACMSACTLHVSSHAAAQSGDATRLLHLHESKHYFSPDTAQPHKPIITHVDDTDDDGWSALSYACWEGHVDVVDVLINRCAVDVNRVHRETGSSALHYAAACGHLPCVRLLLASSRIDLCIRNHDKQSVADLVRAMRPEHHDAILALLQ